MNRGYKEMKQILSEHDHARLDQRITEAEKRTSAQIVLAVVKRSDSFAELPWKAFALGVSIAGLVIFILDFLLYYWTSVTIVLIAMAAMLGAGAVFALLTVFAPGFARLFLSAHRAEAEVRQYAESLFLRRELFTTGGRMGVLLLVSLFERQVILLPDKGLNNLLTKEAMRDVIAPMTSSLAKNDIIRALEDGLERLSLILEAAAAPGGQFSRKNELPNEIIEEKGV
jgi:putative membrane protein